MALGERCRVSLALTSPATYRLNAALWDRCLVMAFILRKPNKGGQFKAPNVLLAAERTPLPGQISTEIDITASITVAAALVTVHPGGMREMRWHLNADEWEHYIKGRRQMTVLQAGPNAVRTNFNAGDVGYVKRSMDHDVRNVGNGDPLFLEVLRADRFLESRDGASLSPHSWCTHKRSTSPNVAQR